MVSNKIIALWDIESNRMGLALAEGVSYKIALAAISSPSSPGLTQDGFQVEEKNLNVRRVTLSNYPCNSSLLKGYRPSMLSLVTQSLQCNSIDLYLYWHESITPDTGIMKPGARLSDIAPSGPQCLNFWFCAFVS